MNTTTLKNVVVPYAATEEIEQTQYDDDDKQHTLQEVSAGSIITNSMQWKDFGYVAPAWFGGMGIDSGSWFRIGSNFPGTAVCAESCSNCK